MLESFAPPGSSGLGTPSELATRHCFVQQIFELSNTLPTGSQQHGRRARAAKMRAVPRHPGGRGRSLAPPLTRWDRFGPPGASSCSKTGPLFSLSPGEQGRGEGEETVTILTCPNLICVPHPHIAQIVIAPRGPSAIIAARLSERSSAWLEHLLWEQDVAGSNPVAPTILSLRFDGGFPVC